MEVVIKESQWPTTELKSLEIKAKLNKPSNLSWNNSTINNNGNKETMTLLTSVIKHTVHGWFSYLFSLTRAKLPNYILSYFLSKNCDNTNTFLCYRHHFIHTTSSKDNGSQQMSILWSGSLPKFYCNHSKKPLLEATDYSLLLGFPLTTYNNYSSYNFLLQE